VAPSIQHVDFESRKRWTKSGFLPMLDGDVVSCGVSKRILRHSGPIPADVSAAQMQNAYVEPFDTANLTLDIGDGGHGFGKSNPTLRGGK